MPNKKQDNDTENILELKEWTGEFNPNDRKSPDNCTCPACMIAIGILIEYDREQISTDDRLPDFVIQDLDKISNEMHRKPFNVCTPEDQFKCVRQVSEQFLSGGSKMERLLKSLQEIDPDLIGKLPNTPVLDPDPTVN